ncbi:MAG: histone deacetylase family protein [Limisphaerales bacterium]
MSMIIITDSRCTEYHHPGHPERPGRIARTVERLKSQSELATSWVDPLPVEERQLRRAHTHQLLRRLELPYDFDADTPCYPEIRSHAERSVGGALHALQLALDGQSAFSLLRPPGHHATTGDAMGFCYLNAIAIAALEAEARGLGRVAVIDFDVHHGNGTEDILLGRENCAYFSIHQFPAYPGTGARSQQNARNFTVAPGASREAYRGALREAIGALRDWRPAVVGVSAGFDAFYGDPLSDAALETEDFRWLGAEMRALGVPAFSILEGGYSNELPELVFAYLKGLAGR